MTWAGAILAMWFVLKFGERWRWVLAIFVLIVWFTPHITLLPKPEVIESAYCEIGAIA